MFLKIATQTFCLFGLADFDVVFYPDGLAGQSEKLQTRLLNIQI